MANFTVKMVERERAHEEKGSDAVRYRITNETLYGCDRVTFSTEHGLTLHFNSKDTNAAHFSPGDNGPADAPITRIAYVMNEQGHTVDRFVL